MAQRVYALFDRKLKEYGQLVCARNDEAIKRGVRESIRGSNSLIEKYPDDFDVHCVGQFNEETGELYTEAGQPAFIENVSLILGEAVGDAKSTQR